MNAYEITLYFYAFDLTHIRELAFQKEIKIIFLKADFTKPEHLWKFNFEMLNSQHICMCAYENESQLRSLACIQSYA